MKVLFQTLKFHSLFLNSNMDVFFDYCRKDVDISNSAVNELLLAKHVDFIEHYVENKESYVSNSFNNSYTFWIDSTENLSLHLTYTSLDAHFFVYFKIPYSPGLY